MVSGDENGDLTLRDMYNMETIQTIPLQLPIQTISLTGGNTHILAPLRYCLLTLFLFSWIKFCWKPAIVRNAILFLWCFVTYIMKNTEVSKTIFVRILPIKQNHGNAKTPTFIFYYRDGKVIVVGLAGIPEHPPPR